MSTTTARVRSGCRGLVVASWTLAALWVPGNAEAAQISSGWWTQSGPASAVLDSDVPADGLLVQSSAAGDVAISAVAADGIMASLTVAIQGNPVMSAPVHACRLTGVFTPVRSGAWADRPSYNCTGAIAATQSGTSLSFVLTELDTEGVVLIATGPADRVVLGPPVVVLASQPAASVDSQPAPAPAPGPPVTIVQPPAIPGVVAGPPLQGSTATPQAGPEVTPEVAPQGTTIPTVSTAAAAASHSSLRRVAGTILVLALLVALLVYWSDAFGAASWRTTALGTPPTKEDLMTQPDLPELVRQEVSRQLRAGPRRYAPLAAALATVLALVILVPDARPSNGITSLGGSSGGPQGVGSGTTGGLPGTTGTAGPAGAGGPTGPAPTGAGGTTGGLPGTVGGAGATGGGSGSTGGGPTTPVAQSGIAGNGTRCGPGVRQFSFVPYSPMCVPKFTGDNGGATAHGVTKSTITFVARNPNDYEAARSAVAAASFADGQHDVDVLMKVFNKQFELYGRQVVAKTFSGRGSFIAEAAGQDQAGASSDADSAYTLGAFASGIPPDPTVYQNALSSRGIISFGINGVGTAADSRKAYPYQYQFLGPLPDFQAEGAADVVCQRMAKLPAVFAGDPVLAKKTRTFGLVMSQQAATVTGGTKDIPALVQRRCGATVKTYTYAGNTAGNASDAAQIATKLKTDGITTVILVADFLFSPGMTSAAVQQSYLPEWLVATLNRNQTARQMDATAVKSMIFVHPWKAQNYAPEKDACYRIYKMGDPNGEPLSDQTAGATFDGICSLLLEMFSAIQNAGPNLTPTTFGQGWFSLPASNGSGDFGTWSYTKDYFSPDASYSLQYWNPTGTNPFDNGTGSYLTCREPADVPYVGGRLGSGQLRCLGR